MLISQEIKRDWGISCLVLATAIAVSATPASASEAAASQQDGQEQPAASETPVVDAGEIVVRAQRRDERLQDTPVSITAISADNFAKLNGRDLNDISRAAPNIQFAGNQEGSGLGSLTIRGIGQQQPGLLSDPGAAVYVDDVYRPRLTNNTLSFNDIERIEVLRGPQGTLFGKNSIGGALSVYSPKPNFTFSSRMGLELGSRDLVNASAMVNVPVSDVVAVRFSGQSVRQDGFMHNLETGEDLNDLNYNSVRGSLLFKPSSAFEFVLRGDYTRQDQKSTGAKVLVTSNPSYLTAGRYETRGTAPSFNRGTDAGVSGTATWDVGVGTIKSISAYRWFSNDFAEDTDGTPDLVQEVVANASEKLFSQELQYNVDLLNDALHVTTGLFYMNEKIVYNSFPKFAISLENYSRQTTNSYAAFAQFDIKPVDRLQVSVGLRYSKDKKRTSFVSYITGIPVAQIDADVSGSWSAFTPKATVQYKFTPDVMVYATVSRGFKSGGVNGQPIQAVDFQPFDQEMVTNYEAGIKTELFNKRAHANISVFRMNYDDMQIGVSVGPNNVVKNAGKAVIQGFEGDFMVKPVSNLTLNTTFSYNDFKYKQLDADAIAGGLNYNLTLPVAPKWTVNAGAEYSIPLSESNSLSVRGDYSYRSKIYFDAINSESSAQRGYGLVSSRITFDHKDAWSIYAYGNNLTNQYYSVAGKVGNGNSYTVIIPGRPREFGVGATARF